MAYKKSTKKGVSMKRKVKVTKKVKDISSFPRVTALAKKKLKELLRKYASAKKEDTVAKVAMDVQRLLRKFNNRSIKLTRKEVSLIKEINFIMRIRCVTRWAALLKRRADKNFKKLC